MLTSPFLFWGSKFLNDAVLVTFLLISSYLFFQIFISDEKIKKPILPILFGLFTGLSFLSRYNAPWIFPLFLAILIMKNKGFSFLKNKNLWISAAVSIITIVPWVIFNYVGYGALFGFLESCAEASVRWGVKSFSFYFKALIEDYFYFLPFVIFGFYVSYKLKAESSKKYFFPLWFLIIFIFASLTPAKDNRYLLIISPSIAVLSAFSFYYIKKKMKILFYVLFILLVASAAFTISALYKNAIHKNNSDEQKCFFSEMQFIKNSNADFVVTEHFSPVYYYTSKPNLRVDNYTTIREVINNKYKNKTILYFYVDGDWFNLLNETNSLKEINNCTKYHVFLFPN